MGDLLGDQRREKVMVAPLFLLRACDEVAPRATRVREAEALERAGNTAQAAALYEKLRAELPATWIDRAAQQRLASIRAADKSKKDPH